MVVDFVSGARGGTRTLHFSLESRRVRPPLGRLLASTRRKYERLILSRYQQLVNLMDVEFETPASQEDQRVSAEIDASPEISRDT